MSTTRATQVVLALMIFSGLGAGPTTVPSAPAADAETIRSQAKQIATLIERNVALTKKNKVLQDQVDRLQVQLALQSAPRQGLKSSSIPDGWVPRQFNGMTYYMIPLEEGQRVTPTTRPTRIK